MFTIKPIRMIRPLTLLALTAVLCLPLAAPAATIALVNRDGAGEGFNSTAAFTAVGGNSATTLGQARLNAFQHAANLVGGLLTSGVTISVGINMDPMGGSAGSAILGGAGPNYVYRDFSGAPVAGTWYVAALANKLAGTDLSAGADDIGAVFNSDVDNGTVLGAINWYYGLDGNSGSHVDFVTVVMHELVHGLGFLELADLATGNLLGGMPDAYIRHLVHHGSTPADFPSMTNAQRVAASAGGSNLHWTGPAVVSASGSLSAGASAGHVHMYAPNPQEPGSSVSHFSMAVSPDELMEPNYTGPKQTIGLAAKLLTDIGWSGTGTAAAPPPSSCPAGTGNLPLPAGPTPYSCASASATQCATSNPAAARPLGAASVGGNSALQLGFVAFAAPVDIYVLVQLPSGELFIMDSQKQWMPFPQNIVPYRAGSAAAVNNEQLPLASNWTGAYTAYTVVVAAGTSPATFSLQTSPYYLWCRN